MNKDKMKVRRLKRNRPNCHKCGASNCYIRGMNKPESERELVCRTCGNIQNMKQYLKTKNR